MTRHLVTSLALAAVALGGCAAGERTESEATPIIGGTPTTQGAVVALAIGGTCSATLLAPNLVLTARHCVADVPIIPYTCSETGAVIGDTGAGVFAPPNDPSTIAYADYGNVPLEPVGKQILVSSETTVCQTDIALVVLDRTVDDPVLAPLRLDAPPALGEALTAVGWGDTEAGSYPDVAQQRSVTVNALGPVAATATLPALAVSFFAVGEAVCHGDSGSPRVRGLRGGGRGRLVRQQPRPADGDRNRRRLHRPQRSQRLPGHGGGGGAHPPGLRRGKRHPLARRPARPAGLARGLRGALQDRRGLQVERLRRGSGRRVALHARLPDHDALPRRLHVHDDRRSHALRGGSGAGRGHGWGERDVVVGRRM